jgi:hypothetical protein
MHIARPNRHMIPRPLSLTLVAAGGLLITLAPGSADAALLVASTAPGSSTGGQPVSARATITTGTNQVTVFLENLQSDPKSVTQCLSGLQFHIDSGQTTGTLASSSGKERTVGSNGEFTIGNNVATGWSLSSVGSDLKLDLLGTPAAPDHTIIGPPNASNMYAAANPSIANGIHSPFLGLNATFTLNVPNVTPASTVSDVVFQFNTGGGNTVPATTVPEPATCATFGAITLVTLGARRRRTR